MKSDPRRPGSAGNRPPMENGGSAKSFEADQRSDSASTPPSSATEAVSAFVRQLAPQERMLVLLKRQLYDGSWQAMLTDLNNRLEGKPYIFKLASRIRDDIERIERLKAFEEEHQVDLADFVSPPKA